MFQPERLTVAAWMVYTGQQIGEEEARELPAEALQEQQEEEQWQVGPVAGSLDVLPPFRADSFGRRARSEHCGGGVAAVRCPYRRGDVAPVRWDPEARRRQWGAPPFGVGRT